MCKACTHSSVEVILVEVDSLVIVSSELVVSYVLIWLYLWISGPLAMRFYLFRNVDYFWCDYEVAPMVGFCV